MRADPSDLRLFLAVLERGSITAGAAALPLSVPAASERIRDLEAGLGVRLLVRSKRGTLPTEAGLALADQARRVLLQIERLHAEMRPYARGLRGRVRLLCNTAAMSEYLPEALARFLAAHPDIDVDLQERWSHEVLHALRAGEAELGILADSVDTTGLEAFPFRDDRLVLVVPAARSLRQRSRAFLDTLEEPHIGLSEESGLSRFLADHAARAGRVLHCRVRVKSFDGIRRLVAQGVGVGIMPERAARRPLPDAQVKILRLSDAWATRRLLVCTPDRRALPATARALLAALSPLAGESPV